MKGLVILLAAVAAAAAAGGIGNQGMNLEVHDLRDRTLKQQDATTNEWHVNIEMRGGPPHGKDVMRGNPYPRAEKLNITYVYGVCHMKQVTPGPHGSSVSGTVYMRQPWLGCADVDVYYDLSGLPHMDHGGTTGEHSFMIHKYGDLSDNCANVGAQFWIAGNKHEGHQDNEHGCSVDDTCCHYAHSIRNVRGGDLGSRPCNSDGTLKEHAMHNQFTLMGFQTVVGRSLVVSHIMNHGGHEMKHVLGCCTIGASNSDGIPQYVKDAFPSEPEQHNHHGHGPQHTSG